MGTISDLTTRIRYEMQDDVAQDIEQAEITSLIATAVERMNHLLIKNAVQFAKNTATFPTVVDREEYLFSAMTKTIDAGGAVDDFMIGDSLYRRDRKRQVKFRTDREWENIVSTSEGNNWKYNADMDGILIKEEPTSVYTCAFYYWPTIDTSSYATDTTLPWGGRMDTAIKEYVCLRLKNQDEFDISQDSQLMSDIVKNYVSNYASLSTDTGGVSGWLSYA